MSGDFTTAADPFVLFAAWMAEASAAEPSDPNAMTLATVDGDGMPNARIVLMKGFDERGFSFFTNTRSAKGRELDGAGRAAIVFHWKSLGRQVRARGPVSRVCDAEADAYYASRPHGSRLGAWASDQSQPLDSRETLVARVAELERKYPEGSAPPRPPHWTGYRLTPLAIEFWHDRPFRLHDRVLFTRPEASAPWSRQRLYP
ncbi:pyridoxamine 5'-phosphate oxidase [Camelimonas abortus]|uniref:Pyridoxine/pyridoxamine 5'-phosphate oxidase n=1 Tax=Camelimonas abortus TaxID=1017184 RepID=A0ABV7LDR8_9HYPH